jgi:NAD(P)H dehydrogenase (quinone)
MQNLIRDLRGDQFHGAFGRVPVNYIDARDVGEVAAALLTSPIEPQPSEQQLSDQQSSAQRLSAQRLSARQRDYLLTGPESPTHDEIAVTMTAVLRREIRYLDLAPADLAARFAAAGIPEPFATDLPAMQAAIPADWAEVYPTVQQITGRSPRTLAQFLADHIERLNA